jgi:glutathione peroxidase
MSTVHDFTASSLEGREKPLSDFSGQVLLVVNTESKCGFTPQYEGLEALYRKYHAQGFTVLGFPCNQFGGKQPGDAAEIARFCSQTYAVTLPMFGKIDVNRTGTLLLYCYLKGGMGNRGDQMEFYEIPCRSEGQGNRSFRAFGYAGRTRKGNREAALRARG